MPTVHDIIEKYQVGERNFKGADLGGTDLEGAHLAGADLRDANLVRTNLRDADLRDANFTRAYLRGADLTRTDLRGADLRGADLGDADLTRADLRGADLRGANLRDADLGGQWIIQGPTRSDGYQFILSNLTAEGIRIKAGCRNLTIKEAREWWQQTRGGSPLGDETFLIIEQLLALAKMRGLKVPETME
jgi:uncharacterized protein YjbI with pentapeptide repeats